MDYARNRALTFLRERAEIPPSEVVEILLHEAGLAIDERRDYRQAARLLAELEELFRRSGRDFTGCRERFESAHGHHRNMLLAALAEAGL